MTPGLLPVTVFALPQRLFTSVLFPEFGIPTTTARKIGLIPFASALSIFPFIRDKILFFIILLAPVIVLFKQI